MNHNRLTLVVYQPDSGHLEVGAPGRGLTLMKARITGYRKTVLKLRLGHGSHIV